ncbi:MAG: Fic family protein [Candidatus Diapherotrites archaeon]|nr:Fic family protein [Candidatus Diapherotrites archaeon]
MTYVVKKKIHGKYYHYVGRSFRVGNRVISVQRIIPTPREPKEKIVARYEAELEEMEKKFWRHRAMKKFKANHIFTGEELVKIEDMKVEYARLLREMAKEDRKQLFDRFTANFTYESDAIEGSTLTLKDVEIVMFENRVPKGADLREVYETRNSRRVMELILNKKFNVSEKSIKKMHKMLMKDIDARGGYKRFPNAIPGARFKTTPPERVAGEMKGLMEWHAKNKEKMSPVMLATHLHGKFEKIHPFADGNGRVGRWLTTVILVNEDYPPLIIRKTQKGSYRAALSAFDYKHADKLERFFLDKYKKTYRSFFKEYHKYL